MSKGLLPLPRFVLLIWRRLLLILTKTNFKGVAKIIFSWSLRSHAPRAKIFLGLLFGVMFKLASLAVTRSLLELKAYLPKD